MESLLNNTLNSSFMEMTRRDALVDRPVERIRFATPQAERRYVRIVRLLQQNERKSGGRPRSLMQIPARLLRSDDKFEDLNSNGKRPFSSEDDNEEPSKKRSRVGDRKLFEDPFIKGLGPIPPKNSDIFANTNFVVCYASDSGQCVSRSHECENSQTDGEDDKDEDCKVEDGENGDGENERDEESKENDGAWRDQPFYSEDRLIVQINAGGGKVYQSLNLVPKDEHEKTKLITNAPSLHPQRILSLRAGIRAYSHRWIITCCQQNKPLDPSPYEIPAINRAKNGCATCCKNW